METSSEAPSSPPPDFDALIAEGWNRWNQEQPERIAVDTETTGLEFYDSAFCVTIAWGGKGHYFELQGSGPNRVKTILRETPTWLFHNANFDLQKLALAGLIELEAVTPDRFEDTEGLAHLLDEHRRKGLKFLAHELLAMETDEDEALKVVRRKLKLKKSDGYHVLPREVIIPYAIADVVMTEKLFERLKPELERYDDLISLYGMEREVTLVLLAMETAGMGVDTEYVEVTSREYARNALITELTIRDLTGNEEFNPNSPKQILEAFEGRGVSLAATSADVLEALDDPLAKSIIELRGLRKMLSTYLSALKNETRDGIIHPYFRQYLPVTGRFSSGRATE